MTDIYHQFLLVLTRPQLATANTNRPDAIIAHAQAQAQKDPAADLPPGVPSATEIAPVSAQTHPQPAPSDPAAVAETPTHPDPGGLAAVDF